MANLGRKNGVFLARFRYLGREYKRSLKTTDRRAAEAAMHRVEDALHRLAIHLLILPNGVDPGAFVISGGNLLQSRRQGLVVPTLGQAIQEYTENLHHLAESNRSTVCGHLRSLKRKLGPKVDVTIDRVEQRDLEGFLQARLQERSPSTVGRARLTVRQFFAWAVAMGYLLSSPAATLTKVKTSGALPPFRTYQEIEATVQRGGLTPRAILRLWDCLYLHPDEIAELLALVRARAVYDVSFILHAIPAYTGMRRGEVVRLKWSDLEFDQDTLVARSLKQSRQVVETMRRIDLHPELKTILLEWRRARPSGQFVVCDPQSPGPMDPEEASTRFVHPLRWTKWCLDSLKDWFKIGFHTYRHSFASNLAAQGVDQRIIDEFMGHQTEDMRKRYRHLYPKNRRSAIECFSLASGTVCQEEALASTRVGSGLQGNRKGGIRGGRSERQTAGELALRR